MDLFGDFVVICCVCFPAFGVIRNVFDDCVWDVGVVDLSDEFVNVNCVEGFTHVSRYQHCSLWSSFVVEALCYCFVDLM